MRRPITEVQMSEELELFRENVRRFVAEQIEPHYETL
jgi:hypothetical protein